MNSYYAGWMNLVLGLLWAGWGITRFFLVGPSMDLVWHLFMALAFSGIGLFWFRDHRYEQHQETSSSTDPEEPTA
ncbi:hypothetical protein [Nocardiopsis kunsanensis]|uniref:Uncharacterized protein n=1 Tax=Nocardiopsis kunsanensis TaxID=141693 RepID=A0A918XCC3_9ACTN|nr:hypothetical protein [Nocardiopsis kunsanensis]GHD24427.1 hypothetical protein GCM10007147_20430 [Nocardiopsis kunsanensis]